MAHVQQVLGAYDPDKQIEWRVLTDSEIKQEFDEPAKSILIEVKGQRTVGLPFQEPGAFSFDVVHSWQRRINDLTATGERRLSRIQNSHNVTRYRIKLFGDVWMVEGIMLSNGVHSVIGSSTFQGTVRWTTGGFEFVGQGGIDQFYGPEKSLILGVTHGTYSYSRDGDILVLKDDINSYHLAHAPDGTLLLAPDFNRKFGSPFKAEFRSEPLTK
jgi:hypothetical protein